MRAPPTLDRWKDLYLLPRLSLSAELCTDPETPVPLAPRHLYSPCHPGTPVSPSAVLALPATCHPSVPTTMVPKRTMHTHLYERDVSSQVTETSAAVRTRGALSPVTFLAVCLVLATVV